MKVVTDPKTGKLHTVDSPSEESIRRKLAEQRRELREMLAGNVPFHEDQWSKKEPPESPPEDRWEDDE